MNILFTAQVAAPVALILWMAIAPSRSAGAPIGGDPLPITFNGRFPLRGDRIDSP